MAEVASRAGVSVTTVSHVVNGTRTVTPRTRDAVLRAVSETGFVANPIAQSLVTSRTHSLGVAMSAISNSYFGAVVQGIEAEATAQGFVLLLAETHDEPDSEMRVVRELHRRRVDGVVLSASADAGAALAYLRERHVPVVLLDRLVDPGHDQVGCENVEATAQLVEHLAQCGHERIAFVAGRAGLATTVERVQGYRLGLRRSGLRFDQRRVVDGGSSTEAARRAVRNLLDAARPPTALVVGNNSMTIGTLWGLRDAAVSVPADLALVAFDDFEWSDLFAPRLTAMAQPSRELGAAAVRLLLTRLADPAQPARTVRLTPRFMHRDSCGCQRPVASRAGRSRRAHR
jgi:LacI family transcriptional regulator